jgi:REP element-mobilizing transposase RayT
MTVPVLIVTSAPGIGEVVRRTLVESGRYEVVLSTNTIQGIRQAREVPFALAILDVDLEKDPSGVSLPKLGQYLRDTNPEIHLVVLSASSDPYDPEIKALAPEGIITTPLYPSSILRTADRVAGAQVASFDSQAPSPDSNALPENNSPQLGPPIWLQDVTRAAQYLTRLSLETASQAALIVYEKRLWAYAGELPQPAAEELAETVVHYWARNGESDLARFVRLDSDGGEYMLYATSLGSGMVLALVFGVETPFSKIRSQVVNLARLLASTPAPDTAAVPEGGDQMPVRNSVGGKMVEKKHTEVEEQPLYEDVPSPDPELWAEEPFPVPPVKMREEDWISEYPEAHLRTPANEASTPKHSENGPAAQGRFTEAPTHPRTPGSAVSVMKSLEMKLISVGTYSLTYGILLIPRLPDHHLLGDLAERLPGWVSQLCVAFAWQLEHLSVRPDYLQWNASAAPEVPPAQLVRNIRKHTSQRIFNEFPVLSRENPSGDFWAAGFLLVTGSQPLPGELVRDFIRQTRQEQGISRPVSMQIR